MSKEIIIKGITYQLTPVPSLSDEEWVKKVLYENIVDYTVGDIVEYAKYHGDLSECYEVISFEPTILQNQRCKNYVNVNVKNILTGEKEWFLSCHLNKIDFKTSNKVTIEGIEYYIKPKQR